MTAADMNKAIATTIPGILDRYYLVKLDLYYRPGGCGYTSNASEAWVVSESVARMHLSPPGTPEAVTFVRCPVPDFVSDYAKMREVEMTLTDNEYAVFVNFLQVCQPYGTTSRAHSAPCHNRAAAYLKAKKLFIR